MPDRRSTRWMRIRLLAVIGLLLVGAVILLFRIWMLQVSQSEWLRGLAREQYLKEIALETVRGAIADRHGEPMAVSVMTDSVFAMPDEIEETRQAARLLASALDLETDRLLKRLSSRKHFTWIKRRIDPVQVERVRRLKLAGVHFTRESRRFYPGRELAGSLVGFAGDGRGLEGIELMYDSQLRGVTVLAQGLKDARGRLLFADGIGSQESVRGGEVVLTIDLTIQEIVETELEHAVYQSGASVGTAIVMEPTSGEILAMANVPTFNPNTFWRFAAGRWRNRAVTDCYEPGSTMKVFTMAAVLQTGLVGPKETVDCQHGQFEVGGHTIHDSTGKGFGQLSIDKVLIHSVNIGIAKLGIRLGRERLHQVLRRFGFGRRTGVDLPGESHCQLHRPDKWSEVDLATISFGQGVSVTPLQLIAALSAIANRGVWMRPLVVKRILGPRGQVVQSFEPEPGGRVMDPKQAEELTRMMVGVTQPGGTGMLAAMKGYQVAGKTGTAQKIDPIAGGYSRDKLVASFMGFAPAERPRIAVLVVIDEPASSTSGGQVAAPAFARITEATLRYLGVFPEGEPALATAKQKQSVADPLHPETLEVVESLAGGQEPEGEGVFVGGESERHSSTTPQPLPDVCGLSIRDALKILTARGVEVAIAGSGRVMRQQPAAGTVLGDSAKVSLVLERCPDPGCIPKGAAPAVPKGAASAVPKGAAPAVPKGAASAVPKGAALAVPKGAAPAVPGGSGKSGGTEIAATDESRGVRREK